MLTFNVVLGYQGYYFETSCDFCFSFFFFNPIDPTSGNAFDCKRRKKGNGLILVPPKPLIE